MLFFFLLFSKMALSLQGFSQKTASRTCPISIPETLFSEQNRLCLSLPQWHQWLFSNNLVVQKDPSKPLLFFWSKKNTPSQKKNRIYRYPAQLVLQTRSASEKILHFFEKKRFQISNTVKSHDRLGIFRKLFLNETPDSPFLEIARFTGFVHLSTQTGIHLFFLFTFLSFIQKALFKNKVPLFLTLFWMICTLFLWILSGLRKGFLRPLLMLFFRSGFKKLGLHIHWITPRLCTFFCDFFFNPQALITHRCAYFFSVFGAQFWHQKNRSHFFFSLHSFLLVAISEIFEHGSLSILTPFISMISLPVTVFLFFPASLFFLFAYELGTFPFKAFAFFNELHESYLLNLFSLSLRFYPIWVIRPEQFLISCAIAIPVFLSKKRAFFVFFFLCASLTRLPFSSPKIHPVAKKILALDVGQGDATCIQTQSDHWFMIDTGSKKSLRISEWLQIFFHYRIFSLSGIYFTHLDEDHCGATNLLSALIRIESLFFDPLWDNHPKTKTLFFLPLSLKPIFEYKTVFARQKNNAVMTGYRVFLPQNQIFISLGDASFEQENAFLPWILSSHKKIALLKISHHGSALSSSAEWIKKIHPEKAWISVGRNNPYGHPHPRVCNTLEQNGIVFFRTDLSGALLWTFTKSGLQ